MVPGVAYGVAAIPVLFGAVVLVVMASVVLRRRDQLGRLATIGLVLALISCMAVVYVVEGMWLGRYGLATMHLIEVCGPLEGIRAAWRYEASGTGSLEADGFFSSYTGRDDPDLVCPPDTR